MVETWEWKTFEFLNMERMKHHLEPLGWCCALESNTRGSCGGKIFVFIPLATKLLVSDCLHWTPPQEIASPFLKENIFFRSDVLKSKYKSGVVIITNDNKLSHIKVALGTHHAISWDNLCNNYPEN